MCRDVGSRAFFAGIEAVAELFSEEKRGAHSSSGLHHQSVHSLSRVLTLKEKKRTGAHSATSSLGASHSKRLRTESAME